MSLPKNLLTDREMTLLRIALECLQESVDAGNFEEDPAEELVNDEGLIHSINIKLGLED